jgi:hypothetical protein
MIILFNQKRFFGHPHEEKEVALSSPSATHETTNAEVEAK